MRSAIARTAADACGKKKPDLCGGSAWLRTCELTESCASLCFAPRTVMRTKPTDAIAAYFAFTVRSAR